MPIRIAWAVHVVTCAGVGLVAGRVAFAMWPFSLAVLFGLAIATGLFWMAGLPLPRIQEGAPLTTFVYYIASILAPVAALAIAAALWQRSAILAAVAFVASYWIVRLAVMALLTLVVSRARMRRVARYDRR